MSGYSQPETNNWYFGVKAGLNFSSGNPVILTSGQTDCNEGVAAMSDSMGNLLFYTDGVTVWNKLHAIMPNGTNLMGHLSSSQSSLVIPVIDDPQRYYLFTVTELVKPEGFRYSVVNMTLDGGNGDIENKNTLIRAPVCEKLTAVRHCNGRDFWVIVHGWGNANFYSYLISSSGVSSTPVVSAAGTSVPATNVEFSMGCLKASPDGNKIAVAHHRMLAELFDFNNSTGVISNPKKIFAPSENYGTPRGPYGIEFSPNSKLVYVSGDYFNFSTIQETSYLLQYNALAIDEPSLQASKNIIYTQQAYWAAENFGTLQTGPDGKIYMAEMNQPFISVINYPNNVGAACQFVHAGMNTSYSGGGRSMYGLPSFFPSLFRPTFSFRGACDGTSLNFDYERGVGEISVKWDFGDPASGPNNISFLDSPIHNFTIEGTYAVKLIRFTACGSDTVKKIIHAGSLQVSLGNDTTLCNVNQYLLSPQSAGANLSYLWQDGSTQPTLSATLDGLYWVDVINNDNGCQKRDSINLNFGTTPVFTLGNDLHKCDGDAVQLMPGLSSGNFLWNTGSIQSSIIVSHSGLYWVNITQDGCNAKDSIQVDFHSYPLVYLGKDSTLCEGNQLLLNAGNPGMQYLWQNGSTMATFLAIQSGDYTVKVSDHNCATSDTIRVSFLDKPGFSLGPDLRICEGLELLLSPKNLKGDNLNFNWSNGSVSNSMLIDREGNYSLTAANTCGTFFDEITVNKGVCKLYVPTAFTPDNDGLNDIFKALYDGNMTKLDMRVYNRGGTIIFNSQSKDKGWDGKYKGELQDAGIYIWTIKYIPSDNTTEIFLKGTVALIR